MTPTVPVPGILVAVVGPSDAGKDTLLALARAALRGDDRFRFVRRAITRAPDPDGEDHLPMTPELFAAEHNAGGFALWWQAHGLLYGLPRDAVEGTLASGRVAVANLSRAVLAEASARFPLRVLEVTAPPEVLAARLAARGRETAEDVARRLAREASLPVGLAMDTVLNVASVEVGSRLVLDVLMRIQVHAYLQYHSCTTSRTPTAPRPAPRVAGSTPRRSAPPSPGSGPR